MRALLASDEASSCTHTRGIERRSRSRSSPIWPNRTFVSGLHASSRQSHKHSTPRLLRTAAARTSTRSMPPEVRSTLSLSLSRSGLLAVTSY